MFEGWSESPRHQRRILVQAFLIWETDRVARVEVAQSSIGGLDKDRIDEALRDARRSDTPCALRIHIPATAGLPDPSTDPA